MIRFPASLRPRSRRRLTLAVVLLLGAGFLLSGCTGEGVNIQIGGEGEAEGGAGAGLGAGTIQLLGLLTVLALAPAFLIMVTSFTRIIVVLSLVRNAIGVPQLPPNQVLLGLALFGPWSMRVMLGFTERLFGNLGVVG